MNNRLPVGNKEFGISGSKDISILETFYKKLCKSSWEVRENDDSRDMSYQLVLYHLREAGKHLVLALAIF